MKRWKQLEKAVGDLLDLYGIPYIRVDNYVCYSCHTVQNKKASGFPDYFCIDPMFAVEVKTGTGRLSLDQKRVKILMEKKIDYLVVRDTVDVLLDYIKEKKIGVPF